MDVNATLKELRELLAKWPEGLDPNKPESIEEYDSDMMRVCELFRALDEWITKGGFLPYQWFRTIEGALAAL